MKTNTNGFTARASVAAVRVALIAMALAACTPPCGGAKRPGTVQADQHGRGRRRRRQPGFVQGRRIQRAEKKGAFFLGNLDLRGGASFDSASALRWRIKGTDLGLETRGVSAQVGVPGKYQINLGYDELRRNRSDSYQTPYNGAGYQYPHLARNVASAYRGRKRWHQPCQRERPGQADW